MNLQEIIDSWKTKLKKFQDNPPISKAMDVRTSLGVQQGVIVTLQQCIKELEAAKDNMTTPELNVVAERLRRWDSGERPSVIYPNANDPCEAADNDAWDLAREFILFMIGSKND